MQSDDRGSFDLGELIRQHQARLRGFFRGRVRDDSIADDLVQETWLEVMRHWASFDPGKGTFWAFSRIWADIALKRHWADRKRDDRFASSPRANHGDDSTVIPDDGSPGGPISPGEAARWAVSRDVATPPPDVDLHHGRVLTEVLACVTSSRRPPHEIIAFLLAKLSWKPSEVVAELGDCTLSELVERIEREYLGTTRIPSMARLFAPLRARLDSRLADTIADKRTRDCYPTLLDRTAGETRLQDYAAKDTPAEHQVSRWWEAVERSAFNEMRSSGRSEFLEPPARP